MKELLKLLTVALVVSTAYAEDVVTKADADAKPETKMEEGNKDADHAEEAKHEVKHHAHAAHAEHVDHVNRKNANKLTGYLGKDQGPWKGPVATIEVPACCADAKPVAHKHPHHKTHHHKAAAKPAAHHDAAAKPADAKEAKNDDHKDVADAAAETAAKAVETVDAAKTAVHG
jgi:hypothetical protein